MGCLRHLARKQLRYKHYKIAIKLLGFARSLNCQLRSKRLVILGSCPVDKSELFSGTSPNPEYPP